MRIAFDLDDTLIPTTTRFSVGSKKLKFPLNLIFQEELRCEAPELLQKLSINHELWVYTTSLRKSFYVRLWFRLWGIKIDFVINQKTHREAVSGNSVYSRYSKAPRLYDIDLLIDDLEGVGLECERQGSDSLIIFPDDDNWATKIVNKVNVKNTE